MIPIFFLTFLYTRMINTIRKANRSIRRSIHRGSILGGEDIPDPRRQTIRMLGKITLKSRLHVLISASVVVLFFISWTPFHVQRLGYVYFKSADLFRTVNQYLFYISGRSNTTNKKEKVTVNAAGFLYYLSSSLNPLLYTVLSVKYR